MFCTTVIDLACVLILLTDSIHGLASQSQQQGVGGRGFGQGQGSSNDGFSHTTDTSQENLQLMNFLKANKADFEKVEVGLLPGASGKGERGLFARKRIAQDKIICKIPSDCALALADPSKGATTSPSLAQQALCLLGYFADSAKYSQWKSYLDCLPVEATCITPDYFDDSDIDLLEFPRLVTSAKQRKADLEEAASQSGIALEKLRHAAWLCSSRAIPIAIKNEEETSKDLVLGDRGQVLTPAESSRKILPVLVPLIDMANYHWQPNACLTLIDPQKDNAWFALQATRPIPAGREITLAYTYGASVVPSSVELFANYGFVPQENPVDKFMLEKGRSTESNDVLKLQDWSTTVKVDEDMLKMLPMDDQTNLRKILELRIRLKQAYTALKVSNT